MTTEEKQRLDRIFGPWLLVGLRPFVRLAGKILRRDHTNAPQGEIVFIKLMGGGSLLIALPALLGIRRCFPNYPLTLVCGSPVAPFAELIGIFDRIDIVNDRRGVFGLVASAARILFALIGRRVDTIVDLEVYSQLSTVFSLLTLARNRIGFYVANTYWRRNILTHLVFFNRARGVFHFYAATARLLGAAPASRTEVRAHLLTRCGGARKTGGYFVVGAGCSEFASVRLLPTAEWSAYARMHRADFAGKRWVFLGAESDRAVAEAVANALREALDADFVFENRCGELSLAKSVACIAEAERYFGIDSALLHVARALAVPSVSFFGPTNPTTLLEPIDGYEEEINYRPPICSPCLHVTQIPPCRGRNVCMQLFTLDHVPFTPWCEDSSGNSVLPVKID